MHQLHSYPEVNKFSTFNLPKHIEDTKERIHQMMEEQIKVPRKSYDRKVLLKDSNKFIGLTGFSLSCNKFKLGEIYYELVLHNNMLLPKSPYI